MFQNIDFMNIQSCIFFFVEDNEVIVINCILLFCVGGVIEILLIEDWGFVIKFDDVNVILFIMKSFCVLGICCDDLDLVDVGNVKRLMGERFLIEDFNFLELEIFEFVLVGLVEIFIFRDNVEFGDNNCDVGNREGIWIKGEREEYVDKEKGCDVILKVVLFFYINLEVIMNLDDFVFEVKCFIDLSEWSGLDKCEFGGGVVLQCELYLDRNLYGEVFFLEVLWYKNDLLGYYFEFEGLNDKLDIIEFCYVDMKVVGVEIFFMSFF